MVIKTPRERYMKHTFWFSVNFVVVKSLKFYAISTLRGYSSVGRAIRSQRIGQRFDSAYLHHFFSLDHRIKPPYFSFKGWSIFLWISLISSFTSFTSFTCDWKLTDTPNYNFHTKINLPLRTLVLPHWVGPPLLVRERRIRDCDYATRTGRDS